MCTFKCCGIFCSGLSVFCGLVLLIVGLFLLTGTPSIHVPIRDGQHSPDYQEAALNCFVGAGIYAALLALSIVCICWGRYKEKKVASNPQSLPLRPSGFPASPSPGQSIQ